MAVMIILLKWTPTVEHKVYLYLFAVLWGMGDAVWQTQINGQFLTSLFRIIYVPGGEVKVCLLDLI